MREEDEAFDEEEDAVNRAEYFVDECLEDDDAAASAFADERLRRFPGEWTRISGSGSSACDSSGSSSSESNFFFLILLFSETVSLG